MMTAEQLQILRRCDELCKRADKTIEQYHQTEQTLAELKAENVVLRTLYLFAKNRADRKEV